MQLEAKSDQHGHRVDIGLRDIAIEYSENGSMKHSTALRNTCRSLSLIVHTFGTTLSDTANQDCQAADASNRAALEFSGLEGIWLEPAYMAQHGSWIV